MSDLENMLRQKTGQINEDSVRRNKMLSWLGDYHGKIIAFSVPGESYHLVFTQEGVTLRQGDYASCETAYQGKESAVLDVLKGKISLYAGVKAGQLEVRGNLNDAESFESLL